MIGGMVTTSQSGVSAKAGLWTLDWTVDWTLDCILDWGRRGVATLRSAGGGWGSILQDYFCLGQHRESQILVVFGRIERVPSIVIQFAV